MTLVFHAFGNGAFARCERIADDAVGNAFAPPRIMHEHLGRTHVLTPAGKTLRLPVAERLLG